MKKGIIKFFKSQWAIKIGSGVIVGIILLVLNKIFDILNFSAILNFFRLKLSYEIQVWLILLVVTVVLLAIWVIKKITKEAPPVFINYTEDCFFKWKWSWRYQISENEFKVINLNPHCPNCDTPMIKCFDMIERYRCPMCDYRAVQSEDPYDIEHIIGHKVEEMQK